MKKSLGFIVFIIFLFSTFRISASENVTGIWKTMDVKKKFTTSIIAVYSYNSKIYGRVIVAFDEKTGDLIDTLYHPRQFINNNKANSLLCSSNLFWGLSQKGSRWVGGLVIDPRNGKIYHCRLWEVEGVLVLRGLWGIFGLNQILLPVVKSDFPINFNIPDITKFVPAIPVIN